MTMMPSYLSRKSEAPHHQFCSCFKYIVCAFIEPSTYAATVASFPWSLCGECLRPCTESEGGGENSKLRAMVFSKIMTCSRSGYGSKLAAQHRTVVAAAAKREGVLQGPLLGFTHGKLFVNCGYGFACIVPKR